MSREDRVKEFGPDWVVMPTGNGNKHHLFDHMGKVVATGYKGEKLQYVADCVNTVRNTRQALEEQDASS